MRVGNKKYVRFSRERNVEVTGLWSVQRDAGTERCKVPPSPLARTARLYQSQPTAPLVATVDGSEV